MTKSKLFTLFLLCLSSGLFAQEVLTFEADTARANALWNEASKLSGNGQFLTVMGKMDSAEMLYMRTLGAESVERVKVLFGKAVCLYNLAEYAESAKYFQQCLDIRERLHGEAHKDVAACHVGLSNVYLKTGDYEKAFEHLHRLRAVRVVLYGPESIEVSKADMTIGSLYLAQGDYGRAEASYQKGMTLYSKIRPAGHPDFAKLHEAMSTLYSRKGDFESMLLHCRKGLEILLAIHPPDAFPLIGIYIETGKAYTYMNDVYNAEYYLRKALAIIQNTTGPENLDVAACYVILAGVKSLRGDHAQAIEYSLRAADIFAKKVGRTHGDIAVVYTNAGEFARRLGDHDRALYYLNEALAIRSKSDHDDSVNLANMYLNIGAVQQENGDFDAAIAHYDKAMDIWTKQAPDRAEIAIVYENIGIIQVKKNNYQAAMEQFNKALTMRRHIFGAEHPYVADTYSKMLETCRLNNAFTEGALYADSAFSALRYNGEPGFDRVNSVPTLLQVLLNKGALHFGWFQYDSLDTHLQTARQAFAAAAQTVAYQDRYLENPDSKFTLSASAGKMAVGGITIAHTLQSLTDSLHYGHEAFDYAQKSKALVLYGSMQEASAVRFAGLPDSLLQQERQLRVELAYLDRKRQELLSNGGSETDSLALAAGARLFDLRQRYADLIQTLEHTFPDYHRLRYDRSTVTVGQVQEQLLQPGQTLLEYVLGDSSLFIFVIGKTSFHIEKIKMDFPLEDWVNDLRNTMTTDRSTGAARYCERAHLLYQKLVSPVKNRLTEAVIIIPDGILNYLPFEALLTQMAEKPARFRNHHYLLNEHQISYCYSATLLREMQEKRRQEMPEKPLLAIAPYYSGDSILIAEMPDLSPRKKRRALRHSGGEVYGIQRIMGGDVLHGEAATKDHFQYIAGRYRILHLATHGQANEQSGDYSLVAFAEPVDSTDDNLLYVRDIYNLALNADLVTLSACETGIGKLQQGEGVISVARAFAYAGAGSIVTSLWDVDDQQAKEFMLAFYKELRKGATKSEALQTAKLGLAKRSDSHPFFWAAFIAIGDMRPI